MKTIEGKRYYTLSEVSEICGVPHSTLAHRRDVGKISKGDKLIGAKYYYSEDQLAVVKQELISTIPRIEGLTIMASKGGE